MTARSPQAAQIFRQAALDRLSSPEQLDRAIKLVRPRDWIGACVLFALIGLAFAWSLLGRVPTRVKGSGIVIATGGRVVDAVSVGDGTLLSLSAKVGAQVAKGEIVARIEQPDLRQSEASAALAVQQRERELAKLTAEIAASTQGAAANLAARKRLLELRVHDAEAEAAILEAQLLQDTEMFERHLITAQKLADTRQALASAHQQALEARGEIGQADADALSARNANDREIRNADDQLAEARRRLTEIETQVHEREDISSPAAGRVTEWKAAPGSRVGPGTPLLSIESGMTGLELALYLPPDDGKQVKVGMDVNVTLSTVKREEFGTMIGVVTEVSDFPVTPQAMQATLQNDRLVQQFSPKGPPFAARVQLERRDDAPSGYAWAGGIGPAIQLSSGTLADGEVTVLERPPIFYLIPWLKNKTGWTS